MAWTLYRPADFETERYGTGWETGVATLPAPTVSGDADLILVDRTYRPADGRERDYRVRIVTAGNLSTARFVFSDDGGATESAPAPLIPPPIPLSHGITVAFTGTTFQVNDQWTFRGLLPYGPAKTGDLSRATRARSIITANPIVSVAYGVTVAPGAVFFSDWRNIAAVRLVAGAGDTGFISLPSPDGARFALSLSAFSLSPSALWTLHFQAADATKPVEIAEAHLLEVVGDLEALAPPLEGDLLNGEGNRPSVPSLPLGWVWRLSFAGIADGALTNLLGVAETRASDSAAGAAFVLSRTLSGDHPATEAAYIGRFLPPEKARTGEHRAHPFSGAFCARFVELEGLYR
jgi:hypothetical protein